MISYGWNVTCAYGEVHVSPEGDLREHIISEKCWCNPMFDLDGMCIHNSLDEREKFEIGQRKMS